MKEKRYRIKNLVKEIRRSTKMTQEKFANIFGIPVSTYQRWETGNSISPTYVLYLLIDYLYMHKMIDCTAYRYLSALYENI